MSDFHIEDSVLTNDEKLAARWDKVAFRAQGSPFEDLSVACLAKNSGTRSWSRPGGKVKGDTLARYIYLSFEELIDIEKLDERCAVQLLEICESTLLFEEECEDLGSFQELDNQAYTQRMRFVEEFGLYQDYPVKLSNLSSDLLELCVSEEVHSFIDLMEFLDRLADKAWIGGTYKALQNVFAHGDENGLTKYFPYRVGHRGFHLPEAVSFCLNRLSRRNLQAVLEYHERRKRRGRLGGKARELPMCVEEQILPEILECLHYFGRRQPRLLIRLHDSVFLCRELMHLNDPQTEGVLQWLIHLALGIFRPNAIDEVNEDLKKITTPMDVDICNDLRKLVNECEA